MTAAMLAMWAELCWLQVAGIVPHSPAKRCCHQADSPQPWPSPAETPIVWPIASYMLLCLQQC